MCRSPFYWTGSSPIPLIRNTYKGSCFSKRPIRPGRIGKIDNCFSIESGHIKQMNERLCCCHNITPISQFFSMRTIRLNTNQITQKSTLANRHQLIDTGIGAGKAAGFFHIRMQYQRANGRCIRCARIALDFCIPETMIRELRPKNIRTSGTYKNILLVSGIRRTGSSHPC